MLDIMFFSSCINVAVSACCELGYSKTFETGLRTFHFGLTFSSDPQCNNEAVQCCECCHTSLRKLDDGQICTDDGVSGAQYKIIMKRCCGEDPKRSTTKISITSTSYESILSTSVTVSPTLSRPGWSILYYIVFVVMFSSCIDEVVSACSIITRIKLHSLFQLVFFSTVTIIHQYYS